MPQKKKSRKLLDLDILIPDDVEIKFAEKTWLMPGDVPMPIALRITKMASLPEDEQAEALGKAIDILVELLQIKQPKIKREDLENALSIKQMTRLIEFISEIMLGEEKEAKN